MKKKVLLFFGLFACCVVISDFITNFALTNSTGAPNGHVGSPINQGRTCQTAGCHTSSVAVQNGGLITSNIPATGYIPGNTYTITASVTGNSNDFGFQISPQDNIGAQRGALVSTSQQTQLGGGTRYITHSFFGTSGTGSKSWSFDWIAPTGYNGDVVFYGAFLVSNNNGATTGDTTKTTTLVVSKDANIKDITSFRFNALNPQVDGTIDQNAQTIELTVPYGTNVTNLVSTIAHTGNSINPSSGTANNFSSPQIYTVTAANGSTKSYTVSVNVELNSSKDITSFNFSGMNPEVVGTINENTKTIELTVPDSTDLTGLVPTIVHTGDNINPASGIANDFSSPQDYTVTAENGSTKTYSVTVTKAGDSKNITSFKFSALASEIIGIINQNAQTVELTVPSGTDVTNIVPTITHTGDSINPPSGIANDFSSPQTYTVTAKNGSTKSYTVSVSIATTVTAYDLKHSFEIYPNPVSDKIFIKQSLHSKITRITVINKNGKIVKDFTSPEAAGHFDIADLSPGIYFIKAETEKGRVIKKIIKQ